MDKCKFILRFYIKKYVDFLTRKLFYLIIWLFWERSIQNIFLDKTLFYCSEIHGRIGDFIDTGSEIKTATGLYCAFFKDARGVKEAQICIDKEKTVVIKIVREDTFNEEDEELLLKTIGSHLPKGMFKIQYASSLERNPSGKYNYVVHK
ncbi:MAG TPA: hypothetical protein PK566_09120 [Pseudobacteroides sp.]|nr:hypothetical protein [Pseudobacteroides sp.]